MTPTINIDPPALIGLFHGALLRDELEQRYIAGIAAVYRLEPVSFAPELDPATSIMTAIDIQLPVIDWDAPTRVDGITRDQQRITVINYPVTGDTRPLTWVPTTRQLGTAPARFGLVGQRLAVVCVAHTLAEEAIITATTRVRRHVDANRAHLTSEVDAWRVDAERRIRDAVDDRRAIIDNLPH